MILCSPALLKSGQWGVRVPGTIAKSGDEITVVTKGGTSWQAVIETIVWRGPDVVLCTASRQFTKCSECGRAAVDADIHRAMGGLCGHCAFDEFDM